MFKAEEYMQQLIAALENCFGERLIYVGLQGSYMRGEATEDSDIDPMVVLDSLTVADLDLYKQIIYKMESPEKSCGFICGKEDLKYWNPLEICHLLYTTKGYYGNLTELVPVYSEIDIRNFVKLSVNNLYHEITHRYIHASEEKNVASIVSSYKSVFYILQNVYYIESSVFCLTKAELLERLTGEDRIVLDTAMALSNGDRYNFDSLFSALHRWCKSILLRLAD